MKNLDQITEIYCIVDDFCKEFEKAKEGHVLSQNTTQKTRNRRFTLSDSEVICILIYFHLMSYRNLKHFYVNHVQHHMQAYFPRTVSYNRFVELQRKCTLPLCILLQTVCLGTCTGISFIDSTPIRACHIKRERQNKVFKGLAQKGQCSIGWFFGLKLHLIINEMGEILDFMLTPGNVDDRTPLKSKEFQRRLFGKLFGDKGYISKNLFEQLFMDGIHLITKLKKNMKDSLMLLSDKLLLRKRALVESVNDQLKNICQIEHTRHRSVENFLANLISGLIAYSFLPKKPRINVGYVDNQDIRHIA